jgi:hypothetical protein
MDFNPAPLPKILSLAAPYISAPFFLLFVFFFFSWLSCFDMSSLDAFETHTNNNDSVSVEKMVLPIETDDVITIRDVSKLYEDISSLYLNKKFPDVILVLDGEKLHAHKVRFIIIYMDLYRNNLFCRNFKGNSFCEK